MHPRRVRANGCSRRQPEYPDSNGRAPRDRARARRGGKGILAADESDGTIAKRFEAVGVASTEENRRAYRELLFTTPGVEEFHQRRDPLRRDDPPERRATARRSRSFSPARGIIPGIKVDKGAKPLALAPGETITEGLDGLRERFAEYRRLGARFAKWRAT